LGVSVSNRARIIATAVSFSLLAAAGTALAERRGGDSAWPSVDRVNVNESVTEEPGRSLSRGPSSGRTACFQPFPNFEPPNPGTCFLNTDAGAFFNLFGASGDFLFVDTPGDNNDVLRYGPEPDRPLFTHQTSNQARFAYCPPDVVGRDCLIFIFPGPGAWIGTGRISVNGALDRGLNFTCPTTITGRGTVTDPQTGDPYRVRTHIVTVKSPDGGCREIANEISIRPMR